MTHAEEAEAPWDVVVVGLGPVGTALAGLLGRRGVRTLGIDRSRDVFALPRAAHIDHTGLRTIQELGVLDDLLARMVPNPRLDLVTAEHALIASVPGGQSSLSGLPASMYFFQPDFDRAIVEAVAAMPTVEVRRGVEMVDIVDNGEAVAVTTVDFEGSQATVRAGYAVGCDGAWSPVREACGIGLESMGFDERWLVVDLKLGARAREVPDHAVEVCDPKRPYVTMPIPGNRQRFEFMLFEGEGDDEMQSEANVQRLLADWLDPDTYAIERRTAYGFHGLVAETWRRGRLLIAGDAAHQMPPFLGQGMCSGLRDSVNLAWKLDFALNERDVDVDALLDSYGGERGPHVRQIVEAAVAFGRVICERDPAVAAERDRRIAQGEEDRLAFRLPNLAPGPFVAEGGGDLFPQPTVGGRRFDDVIGPRFLVLVSGKRPLGPDADWWAAGGRAMVAGTAELGPAGVQLDAWMKKRSATVAVVRPDRYVLGAGADLGTITDSVRDRF